MSTRPCNPRALPFFLLPSANSIHLGSRYLHQHKVTAKIPSPTPFVPDPQTFLTIIGRNLSQHTAKIPSWEALFSLTSPQLKELGVEPARNRRYLLRWREKFRNGIHGVGGDLKEVTDGAAEVRVLEIPSVAQTDIGGSNTMATGISCLKKRKLVVSTSSSKVAFNPSLGEVTAVDLLKVRGAHTVKGPYVQPVAGTQGKVARIVVKDGLWEHRRGHKIDGGERRKAEVRAKKRSEERRTKRK
ncbi:MAG: hypothetical protein M1827_000789 [Pycnora praestabilis]|nr:MAG: hypothetical protein M1827_000789 [Pycnora praestabilis]